MTTSSWPGEPLYRGRRETDKQEHVELAGLEVDVTRAHGKARITLLRAA
jgi:hypothetical protein